MVAFITEDLSVTNAPILLTSIWCLYMVDNIKFICISELYALSLMCVSVRIPMKPVYTVIFITYIPCLRLEDSSNRILK